jgi:hypothetical protein
MQGRDWVPSNSEAQVSQGVLIVSSRVFMNVLLLTLRVRRSFELESEIRHLRMQLDKQNNQLTTPAPVADWIFRQEEAALPDRPSQPFISPSNDVAISFANQPAPGGSPG